MMEEEAIKVLIVKTLQNAIRNNILKASIKLRDIASLDNTTKAEVLAILDKNAELKECIDYITNRGF